MSDRLIEARAALDAHREQRTEPPPDLFSVDPCHEVGKGPTDPIERTRETWRGDVLAAVHRAIDSLAASGAAFSGDEIRDELGELAQQVDLRVVGAALRTKSRAGAIKHVGFTKSRYRHAADVRLWKGAEHG